MGDVLRVRQDLVLSCVVRQETVRRPAANNDNRTTNINSEICFGKCFRNRQRTGSRFVFVSVWCDVSDQCRHAKCWNNNLYLIKSPEV